MARSTEWAVSQVVEKAGGYFVEYPNGDLSGPWKTRGAAELALKGLYIAAAKAERERLNEL